MLTLFAAVLDAIQGSNMRHILIFTLMAAVLAVCTSPYSPDIYASNAVQLANRVEAGTVIGFRQVAITANGTIGTVTGGAVAGVLGVEYANSALIAVGARPSAASLAVPWTTRRATPPAGNIFAQV